MKHVRTMTLSLAVVVAASSAWAQGLSGGPDMLRLGTPYRGPTATSYASPSASGGTTVNAYPRYGQPSELSPTSSASLPSALGPVPQAPAMAAPSVMNQMVKESAANVAPLADYSQPSAGSYVQPSAGSYVQPSAGSYVQPSDCSRPGSRGCLRSRASRYAQPSAVGYAQPEVYTYVQPGTGGYVQPGAGEVIVQEGAYRGSYGEQVLGNEGWCEPVAPDLRGRSPWYFYGGGLVMTRNRPNRLWTTYDAASAPDQLSTDAIPAWTGGWEARVGHGFGSGPWALEGVYWGLAEMLGSSSRSVAGGLVSTPLRVSEIEFAGNNGTLYFDNARQHRVWRSNEIQNFELNLVNTIGNRPSGPLRYGWGVGARYFRFDETFRFGSLQPGYTWGGSGGIGEVYMRDRVKNNLIGCQLSFMLDYQMIDACSIFVRPKVGIYNNHIVNRFDLYRGDGALGTPTAASGVTGTYPVRSTEDRMAFLSEIDLGLNWRISCNWSAQLGYRVMFATGMALADHQVPHYVVDIPEIQDIDTNGDLLLHGAFGGVTFCF